VPHPPTKECFSVNGDQVYSTLPLVDTGLLETVFLQVAQSTALRVFTGLAILNVAQGEANVVLQAFGEDGQQTGSRSFKFNAGTRIVSLLNEDAFFGANFQQVKGHFKLTSDSPVITYALFGDLELRYLSAVEGQAPQSGRVVLPAFGAPSISRRAIGWWSPPGRSLTNGT